MNSMLDKIAPYNLWDGNDLPTGFQRKEYTAKLESFTGNRLVKVLTGQRRAGKSYIMRQLAIRLIESGTDRRNILFINRELSAFNFLQTSEDLDTLVATYRKEIAGEGKNLCIHR